MIHHRTGLSARNLGEWLAALGILRVADSLAPGSMLSFSANGEAVIDSSASEEAILKKIISSAHPGSITVEYLLPCSQPGPQALGVGDGFYERTTHVLAEETRTRVFEKNDDAKKGCILRLDELGGLEITHFLGAAQSSEAQVESPLIFWAGQVTFQGILRNITEKVQTLKSESSLESALSSSARETQRFRLDHADEQFPDDGAHDSSAGRLCRPLIEWLALIGLSFYPAALGFESLSPERRHLVTRTWKNPLMASAVTLALHSAQAPAYRAFFAASDGKMKKLRALSQSNSTPIPT